MRLGTLIVSIIRLVLSCCVAIIPFAVNANELIYWIDVPKSKPTVATISVDTSQLGDFILSPSRDIPASNQTALDISCITSQKSRLTVKYDKPIRCESIQWSVRFKPLKANEYDASSQQSIYSPTGWWLLFEWGNLPRIIGNEAAAICVVGRDDVCKKLPDIHSAPLLFAWGKQTATITTDKLKLTLFADSTILTPELPNISRQLERQYTYLSQVFSQNRLFDWSLIWVAIDQKYKKVGGAAGTNAYIANYLVADDELTDKTLPMLLRVSAHETVHGLSNYTLPSWINESLAEYYAFKAVQLSMVKTSAPVDEWAKRRNTFPHADVGLYIAHKKVTEDKDMSYYPLFYLKGSAFWQELDLALQASEKKLDDYISLLSSPNIQSTDLNQAFIDAMIKIIGSSHWATISNKYL
ncbi:hypothetical protein H0A36_19060 [Endozoicomonas sp. SM1973]|uniref:Uncharacterized protein n=1 Tax=Spartinivicinus marinus TaxID=2994442 RepID=A0A853I2E3_9GAMM|nr:hypothetical protein [Spartinivicinus marinus]MCX4025935.1 hypothetical protein [Spartinivicinus marinus]NYZ68120.1 hypothetical protein [Spartinivicinus marinus]